MSLVAAVAVPFVLASGVGLKIESLRSELDAWPTPRLETALVDSLERTAKARWAEHYLVVGEDLRGDVRVRLVLAAKDSGARITIRLDTQECPPLADTVAFEFKSQELPPQALDAMVTQLAKRAARLFDKARASRLASCIDPSDLPPTDEELERRKARELAAAMRASQPPPPTPIIIVTPPPAQPLPVRPRPIPVRNAPRVEPSDISN